MRGKFPEPPPSQAGSRRDEAPPANQLSEEAIAAAIRSFKWGAGAGPLGTRPDFLKQVRWKTVLKLPDLPTIFPGLRKPVRYGISSSAPNVHRRIW